MKDQARPGSTNAVTALAISNQFNTEQAPTDPFSKTAERSAQTLAVPTNAESEKGANFVPWSPRLPPTANAIENPLDQTTHQGGAAQIDNHGSEAVLFYLCRATSAPLQPEDWQWQRTIPSSCHF